MRMMEYPEDGQYLTARLRLSSIAIAAAILLLFASILPVHAEKRVALVIGNDSYESVPTLQKARNDAREMARVLTELGFDVISATDVGRRAMSRALVEFERKIGPGDTALLFFAGHGFAIQGTNYLLPVDVPEAEGRDTDVGISRERAETNGAFAPFIYGHSRSHPASLRVNPNGPRRETR